MKYKFPVWIKAGFLIVLFIIIAFGASFYRAQKRSMRAQVDEMLSSIARLKVDQIAEWRKDLMNDGAEITTQPYLVEHLIDFLIQPQEQNRHKLLIEFGILQRQRNYINVLLVDANGDVRLSLPGPTEFSKEYTTELSAAFKSHVPVMSELNIDANLLKPHIGVVAPLFAKDEPARPIGAVILLSDPSRFLYPLIRSWPIPSKSGETLLVRRDGDDVLFLNTLRHQPGAALKLRLPLSRSDLPGAMAIKGKQGIAAGRDYHGVKVISVLLPVPDSAWFTVTKIDKSEAFASWRSKAVLSIALFVSTLVILAVFTLFTWQHEERKYYLALYKSEAELRAATQRHSVTLKSIGDAVIVTDAHGRVELLNSVAEALTGWSHEEACGRSLKEVFHIVNEHTHSLVESPVSKVMREGVVVGLANHTILIDKNGNERPIADSGAPIFNADGEITGVILVFRDQSEEQAYQRKIFESEQQIRLTLEAAELGTWRHDTGTGTIHLDQRGQLCYGFNKGEVTLAEVIERVHPDDVERIENEIDTVNDPENGLDRFETQYRVIDPDGNIRWLSINVRKYIFRTGEQKLPVLAYGTVQDVTERKQAEVALRNLNENLERQVAERTALAESRSKQLQSLAVELIEAEERERRRVAQLLHEDLQQVLAAARFQLQGIAEIELYSKAALANIEKLLEESISKSRQLSHELSPPVLHHAGLVAALKWLGSQMAEKLGLKVELEVAAEHQFANAALKVFMFRAVQELLFNVLKHSGARNARVELSASDKDLVITVSDQGRGFDPGILNHLSMTTGGLGLLSLRERAHYVGGSLIVESMVGKGSRFVLKVPSRLSALQESEILLRPNGQPSEKMTVNAEKVGKADIRLIFVDDHKVIRQGLIQLVSGQPNIQMVGQAASGKEALELVRQLQPDLVLMDVSMPEMDGIEATRRIKSEFPNVRIIGLSMHDDEHIGRTMREAGAETYLAKTASSAELLKAIYKIT